MNKRLDTRLRHYRAAVQHPQAEARFAEKAWRRHNASAASDSLPLLLREDFAGTASVAAMWTLSHPDRQAMAVDIHADTMQWADREAAMLMGERAADLHLLAADVMDVSSPRVDVVISTNFGVLIWHDRASLVRYFRNVRKSLRPGGVMVMDLFGGPGAMRPMTQRREVTPDDLAIEPFTYVWEQRRFDAVTSRIDCRIHFELPGGRRIRNAFVYDWRLWQPAEILDAMTEAGLAEPTIWHDAKAAGRMRPVKRLPQAEDFVIYLTAVKRVVQRESGVV